MTMSMYAHVLMSLLVVAGPALKKYGHLRVQALLAREKFPPHFEGAPLVAQFSSLGSLDEKWLSQEFRNSLTAGQTTTRGRSQCCMGYPCVMAV